MPRGIRRELIAGDNPVGQDRPRDISLTGDAAISPPEIEAIPQEALNNKDKLDRMKFNEDILTIFVHPSSDKNSEPIISLGVNTITQYVVRGIDQKIKRKYVETLARAKVTGYTTDTSMNPMTQEPNNRAMPSTTLLYPFSVKHDPAGARGMAWLQEILAEAA